MLSSLPHRTRPFLLPSSAQRWVTNPVASLRREQKLKLYALFKHASEGACNTARPGMLDFVGRIQQIDWNILQVCICEFFTHP